MAAARLSKSRLLNFLQCPKRLWLEVYRPELAQVSAETQTRFDTGHRIGEIARKLYDDGRGIHIGVTNSLSAALNQTQVLLTTASGQAPLVRGQASLPLPLPLAGEGRGSLPLPLAGEGGVRVFFEATFEHAGVLVRTDILQHSPDRSRLVEVKSAAEMKKEYTADVAIQTWVLEGAGVPLADIALAHVNNQFTYRGDGSYAGLLIEKPLADLARRILPQVSGWVDAGQRVLAGAEPVRAVGQHCRTPYECPFIAYCWPKTEYPLTALPSLRDKLDEYVARGYCDVRDVPQHEVSGETQLRVWQATVANRPELQPALRDELRAIPYPRYYLDFETISFAIPIWPGTRPYQAIPYQWSIHIETSPGVIEHVEYLDLSGELPARGVAQSLLKALGRDGPIITYSNYERLCINRLAELVPMLADPLHALEPRLVDLLPIIKRSYYHPSMLGSWSIKTVLPAVAPDMRYQDLGEVQEGNAAERAYLEAIDPATSTERREHIRQSLLAYCAFDTQAMARLVNVFEVGDGSQ